MLEYFGFYATLPVAALELDEPQHESVVARAARLADRHRHTPSTVPASPAWESSTSLER
jgi:hypothetical protein